MILNGCSGLQYYEHYWCVKKNVVLEFYRIKKGVAIPEWARLGLKVVGIVSTEVIPVTEGGR